MKRKPWYVSPLLKNAALCSLGLISINYGLTAWASNFQNFVGINYTNPAELSVIVKQTEVILSQNYVMPHIRWNGTVTVPAPPPIPGAGVVVTGPASNNVNYWLSYGRWAQRISPQLVLGFDITQPFQSSVQYSETSNARYATINTSVQSMNYSPNIAYQFSGKWSKLAVGLGLDFMEVRAALDQMFPALVFPFGAGPDNLVTNHGSRWTYGIHGGILYHALKGTFLGLSYFSQTTATLRGRSTFTGFAPSNNLNAKLNLPATTIFTATQFFSLDWLVRLSLRYTQWNRLKQVFLRGVAGPSSTGLIPTNYRNTWQVDLSSRYNINQKFFVGGLLGYDQTPTNNTDRTLGLPETNQIDLGLTAGYNFSKTTALQINYAHAFFVKKAPINNVTTSGTTSVGSARISGDLIGLQLTVSI